MRGAYFGQYDRKLDLAAHTARLYYGRIGCHCYPSVEHGTLKVERA